MKYDLKEVCKALAYASISTHAADDGFVAMVSLHIGSFSADQKMYLCACLTGWINGSGDTFFSPVADNQEAPVIFDTEDEAAKQARIRANSLPKQFSYGAYAEYGVAVPIEAAQQIFFTPRNKLKRQ